MGLAAAVGGRCTSDLRGWAAAVGWRCTSDPWAGLWRSVGVAEAICGLGGGSFTATSDVSAVKPADGSFVHIGDEQEIEKERAIHHGGISPTRTSG